MATSLIVVVLIVLALSGVMLFIGAPSASAIEEEAREVVQSEEPGEPNEVSTEHLLTPEEVKEDEDMQIRG